MSIECSNNCMPVLVTVMTMAIWYCRQVNTDTDCNKDATEDQKDERFVGYVLLGGGGIGGLSIVNCMVIYGHGMVCCFAWCRQRASERASDIKTASPAKTLFHVAGDR